MIYYMVKDGYYAGRGVCQGPNLPEIDGIVVIEGNAPSDLPTLPEAAQTYAQLRRAAYPPLADLADALYWQSQGDETRMDAYLAAIAAVKQQFPKAV